MYVQPSYSKRRARGLSLQHHRCMRRRNMRAGRLGGVYDYPHVQQHDVLFARGNLVKYHPGNVRYRSILESFNAAFLRTTKSAERHDIASAALWNVVQSCGCCNIRLLRECKDAGNQDHDSWLQTGEGNRYQYFHRGNKTTVWEEIPWDVAITKVKKVMRGNKDLPRFHHENVRQDEQDVIGHPRMHMEPINPQIHQDYGPAENQARLAQDDPMRNIYDRWQLDGER
uniref:DUF6824 domain-containing protein n=1 Tax=Craspedostauros australis TaxID=1486917 RepID=A0A6T6GKJ5_9STRA|mmetsp:Transcript_22521/g.62835  ORF Transcript_22521/g.62835 Transcript_22521/m.62835 type:complete len:227 (+) Transcript_22521:298-978(+)|eukprot:CAMPEP_0198113076 /NCGR_PEP_ID=MMETSP1442-20131203/4826_1 /TAXON_ID= /ORGANISM="Craspedostauros australis, Strain CCMP3328" /LENGTH=226 /DNA_ID=CAMNT_0043770065 /DNA_START=282 /DNA_END=962 /DNA_ORIENTATION=+